MQRSRRCWGYQVLRLPAEDVKWFTHQNMTLYGNIKYLHEAMDLGVTTFV